jgi:hypothetical protein
MKKFVSNAEHRRFVASQVATHKDAPPKLIQRWRVFVEVTGEVVTFNEWLSR